MTEINLDKRRLKERFNDYRRTVLNSQLYLVYKGYYMSACRYEFYLRVFNYISLRYRFEQEKIKFVVSTSGHVIFCLLYRQIARCCDAVFLLAQTEVAMTTVITSQVKDKNCIFTGYQIFVTGKILVFHRCLYNKKKLSACFDELTHIICTV